MGNSNGTSASTTNLNNSTNISCTNAEILLQRDCGDDDGMLMKNNQNSSKQPMMAGFLFEGATLSSASTSLSPDQLLRFSNNKKFNTALPPQKQQHNQINVASSSSKLKANKSKDNLLNSTFGKYKYFNLKFL